jgi:hypothetical protein
MIFSEETLDNAVDEIKIAWTQMDQLKETTTHRDFEAVSATFFYELQTKLAQIDILCNIVSYSRIVGPISDEICTFRVFINADIAKLFDCSGRENLIFKCVDVSSSPVSAPLLLDESPNINIELDSPIPQPKRVEITPSSWSLPLPSTLSSKESLKSNLAKCTSHMHYFYISTPSNGTKILGSHSSGMACKGRFYYKLHDGIYRLQKNTEHTCKMNESQKRRKRH